VTEIYVPSTFVATAAELRTAAPIVPRHEVKFKLVYCIEIATSTTRAPKEGVESDGLPHARQLLSETLRTTDPEPEI
jgi:hypothetical protein